MSVGSQSADAQVLSADTENLVAPDQRRTPIRRYISFAIGIILQPLLAAVPIYPLLGALVKFGQDHAKLFPASCNSRVTGRGFVGNSDFYGLGIRIGIYLQWISSVMSNLLLPATGRALVGSQMSLTIALFVALLLLIFERDCTFTAEMIVILYLMVAGMFISMLGYKTSAKQTTGGGRSIHGLEWVAWPAGFTALSLSAWFWVRLASTDESDFTQTPGGTSIFLFTRVNGHSLSDASAFIAAFSIWALAAPLIQITLRRAAVYSSSPRGAFNVLLFTHENLGKLIVFKLICFLDDLLGMIAKLGLPRPQRMLARSRKFATLSKVQL